MNTDAEIIERSRYDPAALGELYDRHGPDIYRYAARRVGELVAEDVMAETFLIALEGRFDFVGAATAVRPWLFGIATNLLRRHHRAEARVLRALIKPGGRTEATDQWGAIDERLDAPGIQARIGSALRDPPAIDRGAILLLVWAGLSYEDIATATAVPVGTIRSRIDRARRTLRTILGPTVSDKENDRAAQVTGRVVSRQTSPARTGSVRTGPVRSRQGFALVGAAAIFLTGAGVSANVVFPKWRSVVLSPGRSAPDAEAIAVLEDAAAAAIRTSDPIVLPGQYLKIEKKGFHNGYSIVGGRQVRSDRTTSDQLYIPADIKGEWVWNREQNQPTESAPEVVKEAARLLPTVDPRTYAALVGVPRSRWCVLRG